MNGSELFDYMIVLFVVIAVPTTIISILIEWTQKKDNKK